MIPIKENHGFHVEYRVGGNLHARRSMNFEQLVEFAIGESETNG